eukprot:scaffold1734_cov113-Isochrysis_galbana.AAC.36
MSLDWPLGCPPEAHRSRAGTPIFPVEASPYYVGCGRWLPRMRCAGEGALKALLLAFPLPLQLCSLQEPLLPGAGVCSAMSAARCSI